MGQWDVVVLGAGIAGLAAAYEFGKRGKRVLVLEKAEQPGGALRASKVGSYYVDEFYHHVFPGDARVKQLCRELGLTIDWKYVTTAFFGSGAFHRLTKPQDLLTFTPLSWKNRIALARLMLSLRFIKKKDYEKYDGVSAKDFLISRGNEALYAQFFMPLLQSKYGGDLSRISAAWMIARLKWRGDRSIRGEKLGYIRGGFHLFIKKLVNAITAQGGSITCSTAINAIHRKGTSFQVAHGTQIAGAPIVVSTLPPHVLARLVVFPEEYARKLMQLEYQGVCCVLVGLDKPLTPHYWTNLLAPKSFGAVIEQTHFVSPKEYAGDHIVYLAKYPLLDDPLWKMRDEQVAERYLADMHALFGRQNVRWHRVFRSPVAGLVYRTGVLNNIVPVQTPIPNLFMAGMFNSYPERSIEISMGLAQDIVRHCTQKVLP